MQGRISPRQQRINKCNMLIEEIAHYTGKFRSNDKLSYIFINNNQRIFFHNSITEDRIFIANKVSWRKTTVTESEKNLIIQFKTYVMRRTPVKAEYFKNALNGYEGIDKILESARKAGILEG